MKMYQAAKSPRIFLGLIAVTGLIGVLAVVPALFYSSSAAAAAGSDNEQHAAHREGLKNYDIRTDKEARGTVAEFRARAGKSASDLAAARQTVRDAEANLRRQVPSLKVEFNEDLKTAEVIAPGTALGKNFLTEAAAGGSRADRLRRFLRENDALVGLDGAQIDELKVAADYTNPDGNLSFVHLEQFVGGIPVFRGEVKAGFTKDGEIIRVINNLAPGLAYNSLSEDFGDAENAVRAAFPNVSRAIKAEDLQKNAAESTGNKVNFGAGDWATVAEKIYFPVESGVARAAWKVLIWEPEFAYYVIVDAETGALLWRKNIAAHQTQPATYNVYANSTSMLKSLDSPAPMTPGIIDPNLRTQAPIQPRTNVTLVGNEAPYTFNNNGWITDGGNTTDGNAVEAGLDRVNPNGVDPGTTVTGTNRVFNFNYNPGTADGTGDAPVSNTPAGCTQAALPMTDFQRGIITQLFYLSNRYHDETYRLGFTEAAGNFQHDNFGRGGAGSDRVSAEAQDCSGTNNANFATPADGTRGRMQMYLWTAPTPDRDGSLDGDIVIHELTHGLSNRLHGNGSGLTSNMSGGMGEGWSDFYAHALLSEPTDPINGIYTIGAYSTYLYTGAGFTVNYYFGIRRFPKAVMAFTGGPNNRPHNPLTFADIDSTRLNVNDGAYAPGFSTSAAQSDQVHNAGEVWSSALWEVRARLIARLGYETGNRKALQFVTDGMKLSPFNPTFLQARDAIVAAALANGTPADAADVWAGFAIRGMGFSAQVTVAGSNGSTRVVESFDLPNVVQAPSFTISDTAGNNNGFPESGEQISLSIPLSNTSGETITGVSLQIVGGGSANYGDITHTQTVTREVNYTVPANTLCGALLTLTFNITSSRGARTETKQIRIGAPAFTTTGQNFDQVTFPTLPAGWDKQQSGSYTTGWITTTSLAVSGPNALYAPDPATGGLADVSTLARINSASSQLRFKLRYQTEEGYDGAVMEIKIGNGEWQDILAAGGSFASGGYNMQFLPDALHELYRRAAWTGDSKGYVDAVVNLPAAANNQVVGVRWRAVADGGVGGAGTWIDEVTITGGNLFGEYTCTVVAPSKTRADYDGDGKTDRVVFRSGSWFQLRSQAGFTAQQFGLAADTPLAGDFDGDGRSDLTVARTSGAAMNFYILNSQTNVLTTTAWGASGDVPVIGDFNGDNRDDVGVFRPSNGTWYATPSGGGALIAAQFGTSGDRPLAGDFDGDGKADFAVFRPSNATWYIQQSQAGFKAAQFGQATDRLVPADYDGDNKIDVAVFRDGAWLIQRSSNGQLQTVSFGQAADVPVPGDYDGDGTDDPAVYRGGVWFVQQSSNNQFNAVQFGVASDLPIPSVYTR